MGLGVGGGAGVGVGSEGAAMTTAAPPTRAPAPTMASVVGKAPTEKPAGVTGSTETGPAGERAATRGPLQSFLDRTTSAEYSSVRAVAVFRQAPST